MSYISKLLFVSFSLLICNTINAQITWNLKGGINQVSSITDIDGLNQYGSEYDTKENRIDWKAGLEIEIPLSRKLNIETGLRYNNHLAVYENEYNNDYYNSTKNHIELPLRLTYKQQLGKHFSLHAGIGPYMGMLIASQRDFEKAVHVGVEPSLAINWQCLSLGVSYNTPCFHKGYDDLNKNQVMLTLGIRFKSKAWKYIGAGLLTVATVGAAASSIYAASQGDYSGNSYSGSSYLSSSDYSSSNSSNFESQYRQWESRAKANYNSLTNLGYKVQKDGKDVAGSTSQSMSSSNYTAMKKTLREAQKEMKEIRTKAAKQGINITKSEYEDIQVKY